jgi:hypothetical protein
LEVVVELVDGAPVRESGVAESGGEAGQVFDVGPVLGAGLLGEGDEQVGCGIQLEVAEVGFDLLVETHADTSPPLTASTVTA